MAEDEIDYTQHAGRVVFPRNPHDLLSTALCPACFTTLTSSVCAACHLDLRHPDAARLFEASVNAAGALDARLALIGKLRYDSAHPAVAAQLSSVGSNSAPEPESAPSISAATAAAPAMAAPAAAAFAAPATPTVAPATVTAPPAPVVTPPAPASAPQPPSPTSASTTAPRRSSVQVTLLIVGVSLLSVAAIFFLIYAFIAFGIVWRSVIIGAITVAAFAAATLLRRRKLTATAEGIAVFAIVLVYLDAYAVRANNLFATQRIDDALYWGVTLVVSAVGFMLWHRASALRAPNLVGFATFAPGVGILVSGAAERIDADTRGFIVVASIALAAVVHRWAPRPGRPATIERALALGVGALALLFAVPLSLGVVRQLDGAPLVAALLVALLAAVHVAALLVGRAPTGLAAVMAKVFSAIGGVAAALAVAFAAIRVQNDPFLLVGPVVGAVAVALALDVTAQRLASGIRRSCVVVAKWSATVVAVLALAGPLAVSFFSVAAATVGSAQPRWLLTPTDVVRPLPHDSLWALVALASVTVLAAAAWTLTRLLRSPARSTLVVAALALTLVVAVPELRIQWLVMTGWFALAVASFVVLLLTRGTPSRVHRAHRVVATVTLAVASILGYVVGWATTTTWWIGTLTVIALLLSSRLLVGRAGIKAGLLGTGIGLALVSVPALADHLTLGLLQGGGIALANAATLTAIAAAAVLIGAAVPDGVASTLDRRVEFWVASAVAIVSMPLATLSVLALSDSRKMYLLLPGYWSLLVLSLLVLTAIGLWLGIARNRPLRLERAVASVAATPTLVVALTAFSGALGLPEFATRIAPITAALLAAAVSLAVTILRPTSIPRAVRELGIAAVGVPAVAFAWFEGSRLLWLVLVLAAIAVLLLAIDRDGLFASRSPRRHLGWLALALATAGLWTRLSLDGVTELAFFVVPLTVALIVIALLITLAARRAPAGPDGSGVLSGHASGDASHDTEQASFASSTPRRGADAAPLILFAGLLVSLLPLGVNAATGNLAIAIVLFAISAVAMLGGSIPLAAQWQRTADAVAAAGATGVLVVALGRAMAPLTTAVERDAWLAAAFVVLMVAAFLQARPRPEGEQRVRALTSQALAIGAMTALLVLEIPSLGEGSVGGIRAVALVLLFAGLHVIAFLVAHAPLTRLVSVVAIVYAAVAALASEFRDAVSPVELLSIPIALALLVTGVLHLQAEPTARSWRWLGPGTAILLVTSLVATIDDRPLWRIVGLGVVGIAVIVIGVVRRLQAPFVIGVIVVLIHGVATFLPQLRAAYESVPWWLWLGIGGVLLIVLAARYEQRIRNLKSVAMKFAALR